jgi:hypothetical protein
MNHSTRSNSAARADLPDDDIYMSKYVGVAEGINNLINVSACVGYLETLRSGYCGDLGYGVALGYGTALQSGRSQVRLPMVSSESFIDIILPAALWTHGTESLMETSTRHTHTHTHINRKTFVK